MIGIRWRKILRDLNAAQGRMLMMVIAITVGIIGVGTVLSAYTILTREISRNYLGTRPASALLEMPGIDDNLVRAVRQRPEIAAAEASSILLARIETKPGEWAPLLLFVPQDFNALQIGVFKPEAGAWPPPPGTILLERSDQEVFSAKTGDAFNVELPNGTKHIVAISGLVHDPGLAPAWQEQTIYGYATPATLAELGDPAGGAPNFLKIIVKDGANDPSAIEKTTAALAVWLKGEGHTVGEIRIPPPERHPHQSQMTAILGLLLIFSLMALILGAILTATLIDGLLAQQVRQIGIMKTVGARTRQIAWLYIIVILLVGLASVLLGLFPGMAAGRGFAGLVAQLLNFNLYSQAVPVWVYGVLVATGLIVPLLAAVIPIRRATRITVREAVSDYGISRENLGSRRLDIWLGKLSGLDRTLLMALRSIFRKRGRLLLTLGLLAAAGAMFLTSLNVKTAWEANLQKATAARQYDLEVRLNQFEPEEKTLTLIAAVPGVKAVEPANLSPAAVYRPDGLDIVRTYPDGGHGSLTLRSAPLGSQFVQSPVLIGRQPQSGDQGLVVLNQMAQGFFPGARPGDLIRLTVSGRPANFRLVGVIREILTPASAYVTPSDFASATGSIGQANAFRIVKASGGPNGSSIPGGLTQAVEKALDKGGVPIKTVITETMLEGATSGHIYIFIYALIFMAVVMAVVGALGLTSAMSISVAERTREFGIMRTIGGRSTMILANVASEGLLIGLMSFLLSIVLSLPLSYAVGDLIGNMSYRSPLPLVLSPLAFVIWLGVILVGSIAASAYPAWKASRLVVRESLAYV